MARLKKKAKENINHLKVQIMSLNDQLMVERRDHQAAIERLSSKKDEIEHLRARTELIKAMSWAMKTCSSVMWSEKMTGWDHSRQYQQLRGGK